MTVLIVIPAPGSGRYQKGPHLVICLMPEGNPDGACLTGGPGEEFITNLAGPCLLRQACFLKIGRNVCIFHMQGDAERFSYGPDKPHVFVCLTAAESMMEMGDVEREGVFLLEF